MKALKLFLLIALCISLASCAWINEAFDLISKEKYGEGMFDSSHEKVAEDALKNLVNSIIDKDSKAIKSALSAKLTAENKSVDADILELIEYCKGEFVEYHGERNMSMSGSKENDEIVTFYFCSEDFKTTESFYRIGIVYCYEDTASPENVGISAISVIEANEEQCDKANSHGLKEDTVGIFFDGENQMIQASINIDNDLIPEKANVYPYYTTLPLVGVLQKLGAQVEWIKDDCAVITYKDSSFTLSISESSLVKDTEGEELLIPAPGTTNFHCAPLEKDILIDSETLTVILEYHFDTQIDITFDSLSNFIFIVTK